MQLLFLLVLSVLSANIYYATGLTGSEFEILRNDTYGCTTNEEKCDVKNVKSFIFNPRDVNRVSHNLVDNNKKILMSWSPKAACTSAVKSFLDHMGFHEGRDFRGWVHDFRQAAYYKRCGFGTICMYEDPSWYRFKVVRNPYDRAVSSYIHCMRFHAVQESLLMTVVRQLPRNQHLTSKAEITFRDFVYFMEQKIVPTRELRAAAGGHIRRQSYDFEHIMWIEGRPSPFNRIVHVENFDEDMKLVNQETGANFSTGFGSFHYAVRHAEGKFVGDTPWAQLHDRIPKNYGYFYDNELKDRVFRIFHVDILLYEYKYPFDVP